MGNCAAYSCVSATGSAGSVPGAGFTSGPGSSADADTTGGSSSDSSATAFDSSNAAVRIDNRPSHADYNEGGGRGNAGRESDHECGGDSGADAYGSCANSGRARNGAANGSGHSECAWCSSLRCVECEPTGYE